MQTAIAYTATISDGQGFILTYWTDDCGTFNAYQAAPSLNQGYNAGVVSLTSVAAAMPVGDPSIIPLIFTTLKSECELSEWEPGRRDYV